MGKQFTPERLANIRRMRKARRLFKRQPLFAFDMLCKEFPKYTYDKFLDDLRYRTKPKKRKGKSPLVRYGRYKRMEHLKEMYRQTGNIQFGLQAQQLRRYMTKPYRVLTKINKKLLEYTFCECIPIEEIEKLTNELPKCRTEQEADALVQRLRERT